MPPRGVRYIRSGQKFRPKTKPFKHQKKELKQNRNKRARALLWQMRSGKSKAVIDLLCYKYMKGEITGVVILAPNGVHENWVRRELPRHASVEYHSAFYTAIKRKTKRHQAKMDALIQERSKLAILTVNSESVWRDHAKQTILAFAKGHRGKLALIVDESHDYRTPSSKRSRAVRSLARHCALVRILTGTSVDNSPLHAWSQFEILSPGALGFKTFTQFKSRYAIYELARTRSGRQFNRLVRYQNMDELRSKIGEWASVVLRRDCADMPEPDLRKSIFELTPKIRKVYDELIKSYTLEEMMLDGGARMLKLQQIASGWYFNEDKEVVDIVPDKDNPRLLRLQQELEGINGKVIIWARFRPEIDKICKLLTRMGRKHVQYHGGIKSDQRNSAINSFMDDPKVTDFVGQPRAGGTGIDLSEAETIIWYSHMDLITRKQASERATKIGGERIELIDFMADRTVDKMLLDGLDNNLTISEMLTGSGLKDHLLEMEFV